MQETLLFFDSPAEEVIESAAAFFAARGLATTQRTPFSVSFAGPAPDHEADRDSCGKRLTGQPPASVVGDVEGMLRPNSGQVAAVPIQLRPGWCRVWVSVTGHGTAAHAAEAFVAQHGARSRALAVEVAALERQIYAPSRWPAYEAQLRANLLRHDDPASVEAKVAAFKKRWQALGRKAATDPETPA